MTLIQAIGPGAHVIAPHDAYFGTNKLLREIFGPWGIETTLVDMTKVDEVRAAIRPNTKLVWVETPSNPLLRVTDIAALAALAHLGGRHLRRGQHVGDAGAAARLRARRRHLDARHHEISRRAQRRARRRARRQERTTTCSRESARIQLGGGAMPSPFECWLILRGIRTLPWRMRAQIEQRARIGEAPRAHQRVEAVHYPDSSRTPNTPSPRAR